MSLKATLHCNHKAFWHSVALQHMNNQNMLRISCITIRIALRPLYRNAYCIVRLLPLWPCIFHRKASVGVPYCNTQIRYHLVVDHQHAWMSVPRSEVRCVWVWNHKVMQVSMHGLAWRCTPCPDIHLSVCDYVYLGVYVFKGCACVRVRACGHTVSVWLHILCYCENVDMYSIFATEQKKTAIGEQFEHGPHAVILSTQFTVCVGLCTEIREISPSRVFIK